MILCDLVQMLYSRKLQAVGWETVHIRRLENLVWAHAIKAEECYGLAICTENLEYSVHITEDIQRHSSMDNYSCELFERAILRHKAQKHNAKSLEKTFATRENMRNFLDDYQEKHGDISRYGADKRKYNFGLQEYDQLQPIHLQESSFEAGKTLLHDLGQIVNPSPAIEHSMSFGVIVGSTEKNIFPENIVNDLRRYFNRSQIPVQAIPNILLSIKAVALRDEVGEVERFTQGTVCKIASGHEEFVMRISQVFQVGPVQEKYFTFVNGTYFIPTLDNGNVIYHPWTETEQLIP